MSASIDAETPDLGARGRAFQRAKQASVCDSERAWSHGTAVRASRYPMYYEYNLLRVECSPTPSFDQLVQAADEALGDLAHRRIDFEHADDAEPFRERFHAAGWRSKRLVWMLHEGSREQATNGLVVEEADYDAAAGLRDEWQREDFPQEPDSGAYHAAAREVALARGARTLIVREGDTAIGFAQLEGTGDAVEISSVYVTRNMRGGGRGTAVTRAAIAAAGSVEDLWIVADDEDRPKELYARLGFVPIWRGTEITRWP